MPRWEKGSEDRLKAAAMELFEEQGFENTSTIEIAERAGVTTRTFFRYFADKREVLFAEQDNLRAALVQRILEQAADLGPLEVVMHALAGFDWESVGPWDAQRRRGAVLAANPELMERNLIKAHFTAAELAKALEQRGVDADAARLAASVGGQVFRIAYDAWLAQDGDTALSAIVDSVIAQLTGMLPAARVLTISASS